SGPFEIGDCIVSRQQVGILGLAQTGNQLILLCDERRPVGDIAFRPNASKAGGRASLVQGLRGPDQGLGRHTADVDTCPANRAVADQGHLRALLGGGDRGREPGGAGADHSKVIATHAPAVVAGTAVTHAGSPWWLGWRWARSTRRSAAADKDRRRAGRGRTPAPAARRSRGNRSEPRGRGRQARRQEWASR